jgi:serine/threonine protein kinase
MRLFRHLTSPTPTPTSLPTPSITTASAASSDAQTPLSSEAATLPQKPAALPTPDLQRTRDSLGALTESSAPEIPTSDIRLGRELQRGGMGAVHTGSWFGTAVAVKVVLNRSRQEALLREAALLASLRHPCICQFFGISLVDGHLAVVMELLERSLHELIAYESRSTLLPVRLSLRVAHETAQGIAYLHRNLMLHRDIKPSNVMLDQLQHAKVCDFGLSRPFTISKDDPGGKAFLELTSSKFDSSSCAIGTLRYVAPEVLQCTEEQVMVRFNEFSDVYSFGLLLWELAHRQTPFAGIDGLQVALVVAPSGERPLLQPPVGLEGLEPIIAACWHRDPDHRPTMLACMERLSALVSISYEQLSIAYVHSNEQP